MKTSIIAIFFMASGSILAAEMNPTILYVGDSHSYGKLGTTIEKNLSKISDHVIMQASCGATPNTWLGNGKYEKTVCGYWRKEGKVEERSVEHQTPAFADELAKYRPQVTIVQLGTNIAAGSKPENATQSITKMMKAISSEGSKCIWIGPPDANSKIVTKEKLKLTNDLLKKLANENKCDYIDSMKLTSFPKDSKEGIHYPPTLSAKWGESVSVEILKILSAAN
ncbi:MAG: SGNH/GDSL hydrolase family protein [Rhizobacter sp.]|nr:SGNH/GDSL hydrolase family protein [Bacteriovorax sp.]